MPKIIATKIDFSGTGKKTAVSFPCVFYGFLLGMDAANDPTVTVYDCGSTDTISGKTEIVPSNTYDATALGLNGVMLGVPLTCSYGVTLETSFTAGGACEITVYHG